MNVSNFFKKPVISQGSLYYDNHNRMKSIIRLKKKLMEAFGNINFQGEVFHREEYYPSIDDSIARLIELKKEGGANPILLFLSK